MNAINHAATALVIKRYWPKLPLLPILISVQLSEFLWVFLNLAGIEHTTTGAEVHSLADIHLVDMPYSHSVGGAALLAAFVWLGLRAFSPRPGWALPLAIGAFSHIVLDLLTHAPDIAILPVLYPLKLGSGLYDLPVFALMFETLYGVFCWWVFKGSRMLLAVIIGFNLAALSFYAPGIPGPEMLLAGHPRIFSLVILVHIVVAQIAIAYFATRKTERTQEPPGGVA